MSTVLEKLFFCSLVLTHTSCTWHEGYHTRLIQSLPGILATHVCLSNLWLVLSAILGKNVTVGARTLSEQAWVLEKLWQNVKYVTVIWKQLWRCMCTQVTYWFEDPLKEWVINGDRYRETEQKISQKWTVKYKKHFLFLGGNVYV